MANNKHYIVSETELTNIANAIRYKNGEASTYTIAQMPNAIKTLESQNDTYVDQSIRSAFAQKGIFIPENTLLSELPSIIIDDCNWVVGDGCNYFHYEVPEHVLPVDTVHHLCTFTGTTSIGASLISYDKSKQHTTKETIWSSDYYDLDEKYRGKLVFLKMDGTLEVGIYGDNHYSFAGYTGSGYSERCANSAQLVRAELGTNCTAHTNAFQGATNLKEVYFSKDCKWGPMNRAFYNCQSLKKIYINNPEIWTGIDQYQFYNCTNLIDFTLPSSVTWIGAYAFYNCKSLVEINLNDNISSIGDHAFYNCTCLKNIHIPKSLTKIPSYFCFNCSNLPEIIIPNNIIEIGDSGFYYCSKITQLTIPESVTTIGKRAFTLMSKCLEYHFLSATPPSLTLYTVGSNSYTPFGTLPTGAKIYVPYSSDHSILNAYKTAENWSTHADNIYEEEGNK